MSDIEIYYNHGQRFPYDHPDDWNGTDQLPISDDPAVRAARGVLANLCDRHTIKRGFEEVDEAIRVEIVESLAAIIRLAQTAPTSAEPQ